MKKLVLAALVMSTTSGCFNGCNHKKEQEAIEPPPTTPLTPETAAPKPMTKDELGAHFQQCWQLWNQAAWDKYKDCYAADATLDSPGTGEPTSKGAQAIVDGTKELKTGFPDMTGTPQLVLVNGHDLAAITQLTGTHTGPFAGVTAMNQKVGFLMGELMTVDDQGRAAKEAAYFDSATMIAQLGGSKDHPVRAADSKSTVPTETVIAKDDAAEQANLAVAKQELDAFNKHDAKACGELLADDLVWSEQEEPKDWSKKELLADHDEGWKAFSDLKMTPSAMWAAGAYVVTVATLDGTNDGPMPMLAKPTKKTVSLPFLSIQKIDGGKIKSGWVFLQGASFMQQLGLAPAQAGSATGSAGSAAK